MGNDIKISVSGNDAAMLAVWQRQNAEILKNQRALIGMKNAADEMSNSMGRGAEQSTAKWSQGISRIGSELSGLIGGFAGIATIFKGLQYAVSQLKSEYETLRNQQRSAGQKQVELAPRQREMFENLGNDQTLTPEMANAAILKMSERTTMKPSELMGVMSTALSFKERTATAASVLPLVEMAATMSPENGEEASENVKAMQAIQKMMPKANAKDIQGYLIASKLASPVIKSSNFASYSAPAMAQLMSLGNTDREASAFLSALGQGMGDEEGRVTGTAAISFAKQMQELTAGKVQGGIMDQLAWLQTDQGAKAKKKLLGPLLQGQKNAKQIGLEGEAKAFATLIGFIRGDGRYDEILKGTFQEAVGVEGAGKFVDERQAAIDADQMQRTAKINRVMTAGSERAQLSQVVGGRKGISREGLGDILDKAGLTPNEREAAMEAFTVRTEGGGEGFLTRAGQDLGLIDQPGELQSPDTAAAGVMRSFAKRLAGGQRFGATGAYSQKPSSDTMAAAEALRNAADLLEDSVQNRDGGQQPKAGPGVANDRRGQ